jgi:hypothetical protein
MKLQKAIGQRVEGCIPKNIPKRGDYICVFVVTLFEEFFDGAAFF